ncbi:MAG: restriction endonuclease [Candidatus Sumerlaeota bacterium]|nr:restriction endonuclease [Candidatus Sumerlaeota bacterium]
MACDILQNIYEKGSPEVKIATAECIGRFSSSYTALDMIIPLLDISDKTLQKRAVDAGMRIAQCQLSREIETDDLQSEIANRQPSFRAFLEKAKHLGLPDSFFASLGTSSGIPAKRVCVVDLTSDLLRVLRRDLEQLYKLTPSAFENLIHNRLERMELGVVRVGKSTFQKDGGIDMIAWPLKCAFSSLIAVQVKHHRTQNMHTGPVPIREMQGVLSAFPFSVGLLVTNTTFTPDARWAAENMQGLLRLKDIADLRRWIFDDFIEEYSLRDIPQQVEVCPGVVVFLPPALSLSRREKA